MESKLIGQAVAAAFSGLSAGSSPLLAGSPPVAGAGLGTSGTATPGMVLPAPAPEGPAYRRRGLTEAVRRAGRAYAHGPVRRQGVEQCTDHQVDVGLAPAAVKMWAFRGPEPWRERL